jgi:uncharacterized protein YndB with AHSA1/START domain
MSLGKLQVTTPSDREIAMIRTFDAPRYLVYRAMTEPELVKRWLGAFGGWTLDTCEIDLRVGGSFRYVWQNANGQQMGMGGTYQEIVPDERIVNTERFDDAWYEGEAVGTLVLVEQDGQTTATTTLRYQSQEVRDTVLKTPMETGVGASYDQMDQVLASLQSEEAV